MNYNDERTALFIDGSNLHASAKALNLEIDYKKLRKEFVDVENFCEHITTQH